MLIEFNTTNNRSFRKNNRLSLIAASIKDLENEAVIELERMNLLKCAVIYGANASGKSNFLDSIAQMRWLVKNSSKESLANDPLNIKPYLLDNFSEKKPTLFEMIFYIGKTKYRYGFEATNKRFVSEWLFETLRKQEKPLFIRDMDNIQMVEKFSEGDRLEDKTRPNALFLSVAAQFNGEISNKIVEWFRMCNFLHGINDANYFDITAEMLEDKKTSKMVLDFIKLADLGINNLKLNELENEFSDFSEDIFSKKGKKHYKKILEELKSETVADITTFHDVYDSKNKKVGEVEFSLNDQESHGTNKFFNIVGPIIHTILTGTILIIDEFNTRLHPLLTRKIIELFNSKEGNPNNAQLIFSTHDTNLLDRDIFRRDQIYFAEKDNYGESHLYSLIEYKPRNDEAYEKNYISGKYGAIPFIGDFDSIMKHRRKRTKKVTNG
ncbi:ATP/GTP-binding protein [Xanthomarina sp. GH4-25]|uniref:ATP/GTP-binding protein n=1 Tax=Xanthomarina sp. GH4-25 TaxID=3349335 RepID=UPI003878046E